MNYKRRDNLPKFLANRFVEDILEASDDEVMSEASREFESVEREIEKTRILIKSAVFQSRRGHLFMAKKKLEEKKFIREDSNFLVLSLIEKKELIEQARELVPSLTLAARNEEDVTESDADGMIQDLIDLGVIDKNGDIL